MLKTVEKLCSNFWEPRAIAHDVWKCLGLGKATVMPRRSTWSHQPIKLTS